ncbi:MAG: hypothetical protein ACLTDR_08095 [Adlercreutzia equolifaciens]
MTTMVEGTSTLVPPVADKEPLPHVRGALRHRRAGVARSSHRGAPHAAEPSRNRPWRGAIGRTGGRRKGKGRRGGRK